MLRASSVLADQTIAVTLFRIGACIQTAYGRVRAEEPQPVCLPRNSDSAEVMAKAADRAADEALDAGRFADADRLTGLALELRARATGGRA